MWEKETAAADSRGYTSRLVICPYEFRIWRIPSKKQIPCRAMAWVSIPQMSRCCVGAAAEHLSPLVHLYSPFVLKLTTTGPETKSCIKQKEIAILAMRKGPLLMWW